MVGKLSNSKSLTVITISYKTVKEAKEWQGRKKKQEGEADDVNDKLQNKLYNFSL